MCSLQIVTLDVTEVAYISMVIYWKQILSMNKFNRYNSSIIIQRAWRKQKLKKQMAAITIQREYRKWFYIA